MWEAASARVPGRRRRIIVDRERVVIGEVLRPRGTHGEVLVRSQTDVPGRMESLKSASARLSNGLEIPVEIVSAWHYRDDWVLRFAGIDSIESAERFRGADLWVPLGARGALAEGDFFQSDLVGCRIVDNATGRIVGPVQGWQEFGGPPLMEVIADGREVLIPFVRSLCQVDLASGFIRMDVPDGLLDL